MGGRLCEECFFDYIKLTPLESHFIPITLDGSDHGQCDLSTSMSRFLLSTARETNDLQKWRDGVGASRNSQNVQE